MSELRKKFDQLSDRMENVEGSDLEYYAYQLRDICIELFARENQLKSALNCPTCKGTGEYKASMMFDTGLYVPSVTCKNCAEARMSAKGE